MAPRGLSPWPRWDATRALAVSDTCICCLYCRRVLTHAHAKQIVSGRPGEGSDRLPVTANKDCAKGPPAATQVGSTCTCCLWHVYLLSLLYTCGYPRAHTAQAYTYIYTYVYSVAAGMHVYIYTSSYMYMSIPWSFPIAGRAEGSKGHVDMMQVASGICPCCLCHRGVLTHEHTKQVIPGRPGEGSGRLATSARDNSQVGGIAALSAI